MVEMYDGRLARPRKQWEISLFGFPLLLLFSIDRCCLSKHTFVLAVAYQQPCLMQWYHFEATIRAVWS